MQVDIAAEVSDEIQKNLASQQQAEVQTEIDNQRKVSFQSSMKVAASFEPNKFAQALQLERKSGVPARVAYDNWGQVEQIKQQDKLDGLFSTAPRTADALSNPANAIVAKGDEDNLRNMELAVEKADFYQQGFFERQLAGPIRKWWDQDTLADTPGRLMQLDRLESAFNRVDAGEDIAGGFALDYRNADELGRKAMRDRISLQRNVALDKARVAQFDLDKAPVDPGDRAFQEAEGVAGALGAIADDPMWLGRVAAQSLPDMAQSLAAGLLNPILGGATEGATAANYKFLEVLQEKGIDPGDPVQLLQALRNDDLLSEASTRSARYGAGIGAVSIASFGLLGRVLAPSSVGGKPISQGAREWINAGVQVPVQGGLEALGELTGQVAERGQLSDVDGKEVVLEGIVGALMAGPEAGVFAGKRFTNHMIQARRAERAAGLQSDLVARSLESSTRKNDPASFDSIVGQQLAGQPNEFIEIPAAKLQELNQSGMVNIPELLENVGIDPNHFTAQVELGGTIRMKNSSYLAYLSDHDELLASSIRVASNDYSLDDVQELDRQMVADMEKVVAQFGETDQMASAYSDVMGQLLSSGYERGAADTTARQYAAVMTRLAQQTGQTVEEVMQANPLNIAREIPQQVRRIKGDELTLMLGRLRAGDVPQPADMFGKSLRDYLASAGGLDDTGGELAAFDADAGRVGRNRLARAGGQSLDDAAMAAWERGYFPGVAREDVTPNLLVDALREEAAGNPRYSVEQENATLRDQAANLEALQEFLDREGVDLASATDEEIRALLSGERQDDGQVLNQSQRFSEDNRLSNLSMTGPSWERLRTNNKALAKVKGADDQVTIYRATVGETIRPDDFVAVDRAVAEMELENVIDRDGEGAKIIEQQVPVRDLLMGNDATEFVYFPEQSTLNQSALGVTARQLSDQLESQYPGLKLDLLGSGDRVTLSRIVLPKEGRGQGTGTAVMNAVVQWADDNGKTIGLTPSGDFGGSKSRLPGFYKRFGFVENKGKNRDFEISEAMYREPVRTLNQSALTPDQQRLVDMTEDEYIAAVNPENKRSDESDIVIVRQGDLDLPRGAELVERSQDRAGQPIEVYADDDGSLYAVQGGEVVGQIENRDGETLSIVTVEAQGKGIGSTLAAALIRRDPFAQAGSFSPAGEAARRSAFRKVKAELQGERRLNQSRIEVTPQLEAEYSAAVSGNKRRAVIKMLEQTAGVEEVDASFDRDGAHDAPGPGAGSPIYDVTRDGTYPEDFYGPNGLKWYGAGDDTDGPAYAIIKGLEAAPNRPVKIYRAVPKDGAKKIVGGDRVATVRQYAKDHGEAALGGDYKILSMTVSARDLFTSGDSFAEYGYHPQPFKPEFPKSEAAKARTLAESAANFAAAHPESVGAETLQQSGDDDARGSITFGGRRDGVRRFDIRLGKKSDLSTVLHEMGHYYLEVIGDLVADGKANESLAADYGVILGWLGAEPGKMITVDQHEQFARGFEKYLAEGKAPSIELQGAFSRFKRWLTGIYRDLRALNVELSPEVRGVFDRLLASEDAITEAQEALALSEKYESSITALMTPDELANYRRASQQARDDATTEIEQEILRAEIRKDQEWYREQKRAVEREVRDELEASQPYQARKWLFGNAPYPGLGKPLRLDSAAVTELFGSKSKEARFLGRARVREGGVHPEIAASMLGYINPSEMLNDMRAVPGLAEAIKIETERRMAERYPDPRVDGTLAEKAMAVVGEREAEVQAIQLRALAREAGRKASQHRIIKEAARQHIARLKLRDVIPYTFQRASTKAAKAVEAALLDGNMPKAYEEKEKQLMNLHLYREAVKAQELAQKKRDQAKAYMRAGAKRKRLQSASVENYELAYPDGRVEYAATKAAANQAEADGAVVTPLFNFLEQVDGLLTKYEFGTPRRAIRQQREALAAFLASMANESIVVNPPEWLLLDRAERTNWKELTIDELVDVVDMIRQIDQMAKNKLQVLKGDAWAEFEPLRDAIVATVELNASKARNSAFNKSFADEIRRWGREWLGTLPADQIARELDGQDELGPVQENITTPVQVAGRNALIREKAEHQGLADLIRQFYTDDQIKGMNDASKLIAIPEIGDSMTRMQMVMLMANMGNEGNRQALLSEARGIWTAETIQAVMGKLSSNDADFVEALWAWIDKFWPEVSENEARRTGVAPAKVQGTPYPVKLADGKIRVLKGGYFPLKYDGDLSIKTSQDEVANAFKNMTAGRTAKAYTPEGHKIERVGSGGRPVKLSFGVVTSHLNEVVRDIVMTDPVNQAWRFLHDRDVQSAFEKSNLKELFTALEIWMQDTAEGEVVDSSYTTAAARWLRTGFTANVMLFNLSNSALNLAGTHPLVVLGKRWALRGYRDAFAPANWNQMYELSTFMREARIDSFNKDLTLVQDQMAGKGGWRAAMTTAGFYLHNKLQMFMDAVTWMGAYQKGMSMDLVGVDLVTYADQRVVEASGSGVFADRSSLERGTLSRQTRQNELVRGLTTLAGYMIRKMAIARRRTAETSFKDIGQAMNWAVDMALLFTVEGLMFALVKGNIPDDDEEDQAVEWTKTAAWETAASIGGGLPPFGRPIVAGIQGFGGGSSSIDIFAEQFGNAVTQAKQGDADVTALKSVVALVGTATKTPGIATNRVIDWLDRAGEGETPPWYELFTGNRDK